VRRINIGQESGFRLWRNKSILVSGLLTLATKDFIARSLPENAVIRLTPAEVGELPGLQTHLRTLAFLALSSLVTVATSSSSILGIDRQNYELRHPLLRRTAAVLPCCGCGIQNAFDLCHGYQPACWVITALLFTFPFPPDRLLLLLCAYDITNWLEENYERRLDALRTIRQPRRVLYSLLQLPPHEARDLSLQWTFRLGGLDPDLLFHRVLKGRRHKLFGLGPSSSDDRYKKPSQTITMA